MRSSNGFIILLLLVLPFSMATGCKDDGNVADIQPPEIVPIKKKADIEESPIEEKSRLTDNSCHDVDESNQNANDIWVSPAGNVYLADDARVLKYDGEKWCQYKFNIPDFRQTIATGCISKGWAIFGVDDDFIVYAHGAYVYKFNGEIWEVLFEDSRKHADAWADVWINSRKEIFVVGEAGAAVIKDGKKKEWKDFDGHLYAVWGGSDDEVFAVGEDLGIYKYTGSDWEKIDTGFIKWLRNKHCGLLEGGFLSSQYTFVMCQLVHIAGNPEYGYFFSTDAGESGGCMMLRYKNDRMRTFKEEGVCGPIWMDKKGVLYGYNNNKRFRFFTIKGNQLSYSTIKYKPPHVTSIRGIDENNIYAVGAWASKFDGEKWFAFNPEARLTETPPGN